MSRQSSLIIVSIYYSVALLVSCLFIFYYQEKLGSILCLLVADIIATVIIYLGSYSYRNSSIYDPYWSVVPPLILLFWIFNIETINMLNLYFLAVSVLFWGIRLTYNWARGWEGLKQEDWRYLDLRKKTGRYYQLVNFFGIHLFPTIIVFLCCLPFRYVIQKDSTDINIFLGFAICFLGVLYEIISDQQLYNFRKKKSNHIINNGLWKYSRHPNYYGEILFWWGLFIYGSNSANIIPLFFWPSSMTLMFLYVSIPWIEKKILLTRPDYRKYQNRVHVLLPEVTIIKNLFN